MDDAVTKKILQLHNIVDMTTDLVLSCELNPPMLVNWTNWQKTTKTQFSLADVPIMLVPPCPWWRGRDLEMVQIGPGREQRTLASALPTRGTQFWHWYLREFKNFNMFKHSCITQLPWVRFWGPKIVAISCTYLRHVHVIRVIYIDI